MDLPLPLNDLKMTLEYPSEPCYKSAYTSLPSQTSPRVVAFVLSLAGNLLFISYNAALTSDFSVFRLRLPFQSLEGLLQSDYE